MILLDTDICIEILHGNKRVLQQRERYDGPIGICFMSVAELYYGSQKSSNPTQNSDAVDRLLLTLEIIQTDLAILRRFGIIKAQLEKAGTPLADADILVASAAIERAERLITGNKKHFDRIGGLTVEDWR